MGHEFPQKLKGLLCISYPEGGKNSVAGSSVRKEEYAHLNGSVGFEEPVTAVAQ